MSSEQRNKAEKCGTLRHIRGTKLAQNRAQSFPEAFSTNAQIIAELAHARCVFQLAAICAVMGMTPPPLTALVCAEGEKS